MKRAFLIPVAMLFAGLVVAGCGSGSSSSADELEGTPWVLAAGAGIDIPTGVALSAAFDGGKVSGSGGCNRYTGAYTVDGGTLAITGVASTQMACQPPLDAVERSYLAALDAVTGWAIDGDQLVLSADDKETLRYGAASPQGSWTVTGVNLGTAITSPAAGTAITAVFGSDGTLTGSAGCNQYNTTYTTDGSAITIGPAASTKKLCPEPKGVMEQEAAYLKALATATTFSVDGSGLTLLTDTGTIAVTYAHGAG